MHDHDDNTGSDQRQNPHDPHDLRLAMFGRSVELPKNRLVRLCLGTLLCLGGLLWFLPVVGLWMLPLGIAVLSVDIPVVHRHSHRLGSWFRRRYPKTAEKLFPKSHHP